jgi:hypothetical protein
MVPWAAGKTPNAPAGQQYVCAWPPALSAIVRETAGIDGELLTLSFVRAS